MPGIGLFLLALYGLLAVGLRMAVQLCRTGSTGFTSLRGISGPVERLCVLLFVAALVLCIAGPILQLTGALNSLEALDGYVTSIFGIALAATGIVVTLVAQLAMGDAWRVGVDPSERTELVITGPFSVVRNPIFAAMVPSFAGIALLAPNVVTLAGVILLMVALELQTRLIEEPYLLATHGEQYGAYAARVGRLLPGIGRLPLKAGAASPVVRPPTTDRH